jgi:hypothetical protein
MGAARKEVAARLMTAGMVRHLAGFDNAWGACRTASFAALRRFGGRTGDSGRRTAVAHMDAEHWRTPNIGECE